MKNKTLDLPPVSVPLDRAMQILSLFENLARDARQSLRMLRKSPAFVAIAIITLMLGIGANVVVFGVLNSVLLRPLAVRDPQSLYQLRHRQWMSGRLLTNSYPAFEDLRRRNTTFTGMAAIDAYSHASLTWNNSVSSIAGDEVTANYFDLLGVLPQAGRFFHAADDHGPGSAPYVVLSDSLWRRTFHADTAIVGATVELNKHPFIVTGIAPAAFHGTEQFGWPEYWLPMANEEQLDSFDYLHNRTSVSVTVIGRLKPGVTARQATEDLNTIAAQLNREYPKTDEAVAYRLIHPGLFGDDGEVIRGFLWSVNLLALLVLAAACVNLASLFAARTADRSREMALRMALGSSRRRLANQLLIEAVLVSLMGGAIGLAGSRFLLGALDRWHSPYGHVAITLDTRVDCAGLALSVASALLFAILPARQAWRSNPSEMIKGGQLTGFHVARFAMRDLLLGVQIAICTLLITASFVAARGLTRALHAPIGFKPQDAMLVNIDPNQVEPDTLTSIEKQRALIESALNIPGVTAAGFVNRTPFTGGLHGTPVFPSGTSDFTLSNAVLAPYAFQVSPGYFQAASTRLIAGRDVSWSDNPSTPHVAIVNETFAQKMWGSAPAITQHFIVAGNLTQVIGVVQDGKYHDMQESPQPVIYLPMSQTGQGDSILVVRSPRTPSEMSAALLRSLGTGNPTAPISVTSWSDAIGTALFPARAATVALGVMGLLAAMLAVTGIFGMAAYSVSRRLKELGIRMALGAHKAHVITSAIGRPIILLAAGSSVGLFAGVLASRLLAHIVYQANPRDPIVIAGAILTMALLGLIASAIPAARALSIDPSTLMREE